MLAYFDSLFFSLLFGNLIISFPLAWGSGMARREGEQGTLPGLAKRRMKRPLYTARLGLFMYVCMYVLSPPMDEERGIPQGFNIGFLCIL